MNTKKLIIWIIAILVLLGLIYLAVYLISDMKDNNPKGEIVCDEDKYNCEFFEF